VTAPPAPAASVLPTAASASSFDACRARIAKRFHPPAWWSQGWIKGPTDHAPDCHPWRDGASPPAEPVPPDQCQDSRGGWLGIGMSLAAYGWRLSEDGLTMARCNDVCTVLRVADGHVLERSKPPDSIDGSPVTEHAQNKELFRRYGLGLGRNTLSVADAFVDWSLAPRGAAVTYHLRDRKSGTHIAIGRFARAEEYVFPQPWMVSTGGRTLLLRALVRPQDQGLDYEDAVVDLPAAIALLYIEAATANASSELLHARAQSACDSLR
jgi:hypothetical protein